ncbi:MAG: Isopentenyl-diphosphate Delta-isomerase [Alphaproteobacteria bacterium ADurb.Bin438]|nr:MAG: Isopentenyl-diphosphate Delta-isomerase [Alphaproteobacteria bacterium ADurb.Bin438]
MENLDIFDANMNFVGVSERNEAHKQGLWHKAFHCWIFDNEGNVIFQLRSKDKSTHPNLLDISAAGHIASGESEKDGIRELQEELGINVDYDDLKYIGIQLEVCDSNDFKIKSYKNREFCYTYLLKNNTLLSDFKLQKEELGGIFKLSLKDAFKLFSKEVETVSINGYEFDENYNLLPFTKEVGLKDFVDHKNEYMLKILIMIERIIEGKKYLGV